jgi:RNA polymerase sigma-70 factor (ECF subfamily)
VNPHRLARAVASTVVRGEEPRNRFARWSRWFPATPAVDEARFQGADDPYPRHWREFPGPWPPVDPADPAVRTHLRDAIGELPGAWQAVVRQRDVEGRGAAEVSTDLGLTAEQQRAMLNRGRAFLRERLAQVLNRAGNR